MFAGREETREIPHEPGQTITFQTLSAMQLDHAQELEVKRSMSFSKDMPAEVIERLQAGVEDRELKPGDTYHKPTMIRWGIKAWSHDSPCTDENKEKLDMPTRDWAFSVIVEMNVRPLVTGSDSTTNSSTENSHKNLSPLTASSSPE